MESSGRDFEARFVDFPDGMTEYVIGDEMDQARRCLRVDDYSGSEDGLPTDSWVLTLVAPGYGSQTLIRLIMDFYFLPHTKYQIL